MFPRTFFLRFGLFAAMHGCMESCLLVSFLATASRIISRICPWMWSFFFAATTMQSIEKLEALAVQRREFKRKAQELSSELRAAKKRRSRILQKARGLSPEDLEALLREKLHSRTHGSETASSSTGGGGQTKSQKKASMKEKKVVAGTDAASKQQEAIQQDEDLICDPHAAATNTEVQSVSVHTDSDDAGQRQEGPEKDRDQILNIDTVVKTSK